MGNARGRARNHTVENHSDCVANSNSRRCSSGCGCRRCLGRIAEVPADCPSLSLHKQLLATLIDGVVCLPQDVANLIALYAASPGRIVLGLGSMLYLVEADTFQINAQVNVGNSIAAIMLLSNTTICVCSKEYDSWSSGEGFAVKSFSLPSLRPERELAIDQEFFDPNWLPLKYNEEGAWLHFKKGRAVRLFSSRFSSKRLATVPATLPPQLLFDGRIVIVDKHQLAVHSARVAWNSGTLLQVLPSVLMASPILAFTVFAWGALVTIAAGGLLTLFQVGKFGLAVQRAWKSPALSHIAEGDSVVLAPLSGGQVGVVVDSCVMIIDVESQTDKVRMKHFLPVESVCVLPNDVLSTCTELGSLGTVTYPEC